MDNISNLRFLHFMVFPCVENKDKVVFFGKVNHSLEYLWKKLPQNIYKKVCYVDKPGHIDTEAMEIVRWSWKYQTKSFLNRLTLNNGKQGHAISTFIIKPEELHGNKVEQVIIDDPELETREEYWKNFIKKFDKMNTELEKY